MYQIQTLTLGKVQGRFTTKNPTYGRFYGKRRTCCFTLHWKGGCDDILLKSFSRVEREDSLNIIVVL